jgi:hypothetical protein
MVALAIKVFVLSAMIRLLVATDKPWLCAGIYAAVVFVIGAVFGDEIATVALMAGLAFIAAFIYFWILDRLDTSSIAWWIVSVIGIPLVFL